MRKFIALIAALAGFGGAASSNSKNTWTLGASYDLRVVKIFAGLESDRRYSSNRSAGHVGVSAPLGAGKIMAWYGQDQNGGVTLNDKARLGRLFVRPVQANRFVRGRG